MNYQHLPKGAVGTRRDGVWEPLSIQHPLEDAGIYTYPYYPCYLTIPFLPESHKLLPDLTRDMSCSFLRTIASFLEDRSFVLTLFFENHHSTNLLQHDNNMNTRWWFQPS